MTDFAEILFCDGTFFPLLEQDWNRWIRAWLYLLALLYLFLGISIIAEQFVSSVEVITSHRILVKDAVTGRSVTVHRWNATVANLTLLALGSSAPEILLSVVEIFMNGFLSGDLGPSTIVGSAAFNLFVIVGVCVAAIPSPETRQLKELGVFGITSFCSVFAYLWLVFIVTIVSPDVVEVWEGVVTLLFFPLLVGVSYMSDIGWFSKGMRRPVFNSPPTVASFALSETATPDTPKKTSYTGSGTFSVTTSWTSRRLSQPTVDGSILLCRTRSHEDILLSDGTPISHAAGILTFESDTLDVVAGSEQQTIKILVLRRNGVEGRVGCSWRTERLSAVPGFDYEEESGEVCFLSGETKQIVSVQILTKEIWERNDQFQVILSNIWGGATFNPNADGGASINRLTVTIANVRRVRVSCCFLLDTALNVDSCRSAILLWRQQIREALYDWPQSDPADLSFIMHLLSFPWKFLFAVLAPPPSMAGGWACFVCALAHIGSLTLFVIDFAQLFGCCAGLADAVTAITLVALGSSMPDLFASMAAARADDFADASIVNVTGSNSVNVFIGIGLPWTIAAFFWFFHGSTSAWRETYAGRGFNEGDFVVEGGNLAFSVWIFSGCAVAALALLVARRIKVGGELGGPLAVKTLSTVFFLLLWVCYVVLSIWKVENGDASFEAQRFAVFLVFVGFVVTVTLLYFLLLWFGAYLAPEPQRNVLKPARSLSSCFSKSRPPVDDEGTAFVTRRIDLDKSCEHQGITLEIDSGSRMNTLEEARGVDTAGPDVAHLEELCAPGGQLLPTLLGSQSRNKAADEDALRPRSSMRTRVKARQSDFSFGDVPQPFWQGCDVPPDPTAQAPGSQRGDTPMVLEQSEEKDEHESVECQLSDAALEVDVTPEMYS